jgi:ABC-type antimicrobial peptide transport system permease subunit
LPEAIRKIKGFHAIPAKETWLQMLGRPVFSWDVALVTVTILSIIGFFAGFFPARKASRIQPTEALHYE